MTNEEPHTANTGNSCTTHR